MEGCWTDQGLGAIGVYLCRREAHPTRRGEYVHGGGDGGGRGWVVEGELPADDMRLVEF